MAKKIHEVK